MRANEMIPILSEAFGYPFDAAYRIDRVLAEAGLRTKGKGRSLPEMDRREALTFLLACMVVEKITKADEEVSPWLSALGSVNKDPRLLVFDEWDEPDLPARTKLYYEMKELLVGHMDDNGEVRLIDYLIATCALLQNQNVLPEQVKLEIEFSTSSATLSIRFNEEDSLTEQFFATDSRTQRSIEFKNPDTAINRKCSITGAALIEIIERT